MKIHYFEIKIFAYKNALRLPFQWFYVENMNPYLKFFPIKCFIEFFFSLEKWCFLPPLQKYAILSSLTEFTSEAKMNAPSCTSENHFPTRC